MDDCRSGTPAEGSRSADAPTVFQSTTVNTGAINIAAKQLLEESGGDAFCQNGGSVNVAPGAVFNASVAFVYINGVSGLSSGEIEVKYTLLGDANLDGVVNGADFSILAANFGKGATNWDQGNFLFGSAVNGADFSALDAFAAANGLTVDVPDPSAIALLSLCAASALTWRSRKRCRLCLSSSPGTGN